MTECTSCKNKECSSTIRCEICQKKAFCSEECRQHSWSSHVQDCNVIDVEIPNLTRLMYSLGDNVDLSELPSSSEPNQSFILRYVDPKGVISHTLVEASVNMEPDEENLQEKISQNIAEMNYDVKIQHFDDITSSEPDGEWLISGLNVGNSVISKTSPITKLQNLAKIRQNSSDYALWVDKISSPISIPSSGYLKFSLLVGGEEKSNIDTCYEIREFDPKFNNWLIRKSRNLLPFQEEYKTKYGETNLQNLQMYKAISDNGAVQVTFRVPQNDEIQLVDLEYHIPKDILLGNDVSIDSAADSIDMDFAIDHNSLEQVTGLIMAMEHHMETGDLSGELINQQFTIIDKHREELEKIYPETMQMVPQRVSTAINHVTRQMWDLVERGAFKKRVDRWKTNIREAKDIEADKIRMSKITDARTLFLKIDEYLQKAKSAQEQYTPTSDLHDGGKYLARAKYGIYLYDKKFVTKEDNPKKGKFGTGNNDIEFESRLKNLKELQSRYDELSIQEDFITKDKSNVRKERSQQIKKRGFKK